MSARHSNVHIFYNKEHEKCSTPAVDIEVIKNVFVNNLNEKFANKEDLQR